MKKLIWLSLLLAVVAGLTGCAKPEKPLKVYWPPPPNTPRLEWITTFSSEDNFPKTEGQRATEAVLGKPELHFLQKPLGVVSNSKGVVYVVDADVNNVRVIDFNKKTIELLSKQPVFRLPIGIALDAEENIYVVDGGSRTILVFNAAGQPIKNIGSEQDFGKPAYVAINQRLGRMYVTDVLQHKVVVFGLDGEKLFEFGKPGNGEGDLYGPQGVAIDSLDRVFVAEQFNTRVQGFDADGKHLVMFGERGDKDWQFEGPRGIAFDSDDNLYVAEGRKAALMIFTADGTPLTQLGGTRSTHQLGFTLPAGMAVDQNDRVYITDSMNRRMTIWQYMSDEYRKQFPPDEETLKKLEEKIKRISK